MSILQRLKTETTPFHQQTETRLYADAIRAGTLTTAQYTHLLQIHYAFHQPLELAIAQHPSFFEEYDGPKRRKVPSLLTDAQAIGLTLQAADDALFSDWDRAGLLGAAYVAEGSTLGGKLIGHYLAQSPQLTLLIGHSQFYAGYGEQTGAQWRSFGKFLTEKPADYHEAVIDGAKRAFRLYDTLFDRYSTYQNSF